jgi:hypothetical protein
VAKVPLANHNVSTDSQTIVSRFQFAVGTAGQNAKNHQHLAGPGGRAVAEAACSIASIGPRITSLRAPHGAELTHLGSLRRNRCHGEEGPTTYCWLSVLLKSTLTQEIVLRRRCGACRYETAF